ncbi:AAA family ATPase [Alkalihalobacillus oceani]|uniref:AAA family ATPase n=1 Tax=Halalkalibacter oceani TaxID=1653776 RepID=A0A9X2DMC0_9BACI|nr:AAA family ATPase [Halalkalibacter oceani]MCM3713409.1 AAA family ATPase [Halalkalibacter oceani]
MLQRKWSLADIKQWLENRSEEEQPLQEATAWEILEALEGREEELAPVYRAQLYALLASARLERTGQLDPVIERWQERAATLSPESGFVQRITCQIMLKKIGNQLRLPEFPVIRETDHSSAKKKAANDYRRIAQRFFSFEKELTAEWERGRDLLLQQKEGERLERLYQLMTELKQPFSRILEATGEYADSVQGIYYSAAQFKQIKQAEADIKLLFSRLDELLPQSAEEQEPEALVELQSLIGLNEVKERIAKLHRFLHYQKERQEQGFQIKDGMAMHMILTGNPGTGKTHLARVIAKIYYELGLLTRDEVYEVDRAALVGAYVGQTEEQTQKAIERALGGVLFIDEAYSLRRADASGNDYGQAVIDTLVSAMTSGKYAGQFAVILAGYPAEMRTFLRSNPGLRSRFPEQNHIHLPDYTIDELLQIGAKMALENDYMLTQGAKRELQRRIERAAVDESFGNARTVKNLILEAIFEKGAELTLTEAKADDFVFLDAEHFQANEETEQAAIQSLEALVGLKAVKREIKQLTSFADVQQKRREQGLQALPLQLHAVFTGNPGTGKTTVAELFAKALHEIGLLKRGHLVVAGRADLVAGYVGQTAQKTKELIRDALGGVLFIDEAYALLSAGKGDFGMEAIHTLVQEMTVHQENLVVILAGYEQEMERLLASNPGLRSRFKKQLSFDDYTKEELVEIVLERAEQADYRFSGRAKSILETEVMLKKHPANARYAVDVFERLVQLQALRLQEQQAHDAEQLMTITEEDLRLLVTEGGHK